MPFANSEGTHDRRHPESTGKKAAAAATLSEAELAAVRERMVAAGVDVSERLRAELIAGGRSNLTFRLDDGVGSWVLRMPPRVGRTPSAHDVAREHRVTSALTGSDVPVARPVVLCEDESAIGLPFFVAEYVAGVTVRSDSDLAALERRDRGPKRPGDRGGSCGSASSGPRRGGFG